MKYFWLFIKKTLRFLLKPLSFVPAIIMICVIFRFSSMTGTASADTSYKVSKVLVLGVNRIMDEGWDNNKLEQLINTIHPYVRKMAHVTEYFLLAAAVALPLYVYKIRGIAMMLLTVVICIGIAWLDEYNQAGVMGRVGDFRDVLIDSCGIVAATIVVRILGFTCRKTVFSWLCLDDCGKKTYR